MRSFMIRPAFILLLAWILTGCETVESWRVICSSDEDCPENFYCDTLTGLCKCANDQACDPDEYCAPDGTCKRRMSCDNNLDCPADTFCDTTTGNCIELGKCTQDTHCPFGEICSDTYFRCIPGCRTSGDCPLGEVCHEEKCREGMCEDKTYCDVGQLCDAATQTCYDDDRGPYCAHCTSSSIYQPHQCGPGPNFCLIPSGDLTAPLYCGIDCRLGQPCPNGYECYSVRIVYTSEACRADEECESGECGKKEGEEWGFCLCTRDEHCPQDYCDEFNMECRTTRRPCTPGGNECDRPIYCIDGKCHIGYNCKPKEGLRCFDLID